MEASSAKFVAMRVGGWNILAATEPAKLTKLKTLLTAKYHEVRDESPTWPAWEFTASEGKKIVWPDYVRKPKAGKK